MHCLLLQIFVIINKVFSRFARWGSKKIGLLKNTYAKLPKAIDYTVVVFKLRIVKLVTLHLSSFICIM
jgi:hypothetical protein